MLYSIMCAIENQLSVFLIFFCTLWHKPTQFASRIISEAGISDLFINLYHTEMRVCFQ